MSFRVIGLSGPAGCGKDTAARYLATMHGYGVYAFAAPIKAALNAMFGWSPESWENREWKERELPAFGKSPRQMAQTLGTEWGRQLVNADLWLLLAAQRCDAARAVGLPGIVFTDCRFVNEAQFVKDREGLVIQITRDACAPVAGHVSERGLPPDLVSAVVPNNGGRDELYANIRGVLGVPEGTDDGAPNCGHMSRTRRVCTRLDGHHGPHADRMTQWPREDGEARSPAG